MSGELTIRLRAAPHAAPLLRQAVREHLGPDGHPDAELCVTELLTNVIAHLGPGTPVTLRVTGTGRAARTRVELTDPAPHRPVAPRTAGGTDESGRGLALLDALAVRWGGHARAGHQDRVVRVLTLVTVAGKGLPLLPTGSIMNVTDWYVRGTCLPSA
ncbi:ATP-binding protein [Streptomyces sp. NPDC012888]|uniref:ATP-binding protein n=1 Tax=Streptomyces sp. NPDC012888 TaxID=3364855 RepID=UPI0036B7D6D9